MKTVTLSEDANDYNWRLSGGRDDAPYELSLYKNDGPEANKYQAVVIKPIEYGVQFYSQKVKNLGDRIEWGGSHTTMKNYKDLETLNNFLEKAGYPRVEDKMYNTIKSDEYLIIGVPGITIHYFEIPKSFLKTICDGDEDKFFTGIARWIRERTKHWPIGNDGKKLTDESRKLLKQFWESNRS